MSGNLQTFLLFGIILVPVTVAVTRAVLGGALEASRERLAAAQEDVARLRGEKSELLNMLEEHGESISDIKAELARVPRHFIGEGPPPEQGDFRPGDLWITTSDKTAVSPDDIGDDELAILKMLANDPSEEYTAASLAFALGRPEVVIQHKLGRLEERGFVLAREIIDEPLQYRLDRIGRAFIAGIMDRE